jgi:hypothetical protein
MAIQIFSNNLPGQYREPVQAAVIEAMANPEGDWRFQIHENQESPGWHVTIWGLTKDFHWTHEFLGTSCFSSDPGF